MNIPFNLSTLQPFNMNVTFLGTGAADWDWRNMPPDTRGSTATLIGKSCLIDAGPTVIRSITDAGIQPSRIAHVVITHSHSDHLQPAAIAALAEARCGKLTVWASPQAFAPLEGIPCVRHEVAAGLAFKCGRFTFTALPANHQTPHQDEECLHYLVESGGKTLLYALDGAWMLAKALNRLTKALDGRKLDAVIWDATCGPTLNDWRFAEHNDLAMIDAMRKSMIGAGLVSPTTRHVFDHLARTLWPEEPSARAALAAAYGGILAEDGDGLTV